MICQALIIQTLSTRLCVLKKLPDGKGDTSEEINVSIQQIFEWMGSGNGN